MQHVRESGWGTHRTAEAGWRSAAILMLAISICVVAFAMTRPARVERVLQPIRLTSERQVVITSSAATHEAGPYAEPVEARRARPPADHIAGVTYPVRSPPSGS